MKALVLVVSMLVTSNAVAAPLPGAEPESELEPHCYVYPRHTVVVLEGETGETLIVRQRVNGQLKSSTLCSTSPDDALFVRAPTGRAFFAGIVGDVLLVEEADANTVLSGYHLPSGERLFNVYSVERALFDRPAGRLRILAGMEQPPCVTAQQENDVTLPECKAQLAATWQCLQRHARFRKPMPPPKLYLDKGGTACQYAVLEWLDFDVKRQQLVKTGRVETTLLNVLAD